MTRALIVLCALLAVPAAATNIAVSQGFVADKLYDFHDFDSINTFNGNLILDIPVGPSYPVNGGFAYGLSLAYNSKVWTYTQAGGATRAIPDPRSNAGMGWSLSLGHLITSADAFGDEDVNSYRSPDGAVHKFFATLHDGDPATTLTTGVTSVGYTRDGSYLRQLIKSNGTIDVEFPDGIVHNFNSTTGKLNTIRDRYNNGITLTYFTSLNISLTACPATDVYAWQITDTKANRTNWVCFKPASYPDTTVEGQVDRVILAAPSTSAGGARTSTYVFGYTQTTVNRGCHSSYGGDPITVSVPMLTSISLPTGAAYTFAYNTNAPNSSCEQGTLNMATLPTGGTLRYTYRYYQIPSTPCGAPSRPMYESITGVGTRTVQRPGYGDATWTYTSAVNSPSFYIWCTSGDTQFQKLGPPEQLAVAVKDPLGNVTEHYYSVWPGDGASPNGPMPEEYGLPLTRLTAKTSTTNVPSGWPAPSSLFLSERVYTPAGWPTRAPLREVYVAYDQDPITAGCSEQSWCDRTNPRRRIEQTVFPDDGNRVLQISHTDFDGLGHYRSELRAFDSGNFTGGLTTSYTGFNTRDSEVNPTSGIASGTYTTMGTYTPPTAATPWIINTAPRASVTEGSTTFLTQTCWDPNKGSVRFDRTRLSASAQNVKDTVAAYTRDTAGNITAETFYGGDIKANAPSGALCSAVAPTTSTGYDYKINHTYQAGARNTSTYAGSSYKFLDLTIDAPSGAVMKSFDTSGLLTTYGYDTAFRVTSVVAPGTGTTTFTYSNASVSSGVLTPAQVTMSRTASTAQGSKSVYQYDALGRLWRTKQLLPDGTYGVRETLFDLAGNIASASAQERLVIPVGSTEFSVSPAHKTQFSGYDPFGRVGTVARPDATVTSFVYYGIRQTERTVSVQMTAGATNVTTREVNDAAGRLASVTEGGVTTSYTYDAANHLKTVSMPTGTSTQSRAFNYDGRGFATSEIHPEIGIGGYATLTRSQFDARGHAHRSATGTTGAFDLTTTFDESERVTQIALTSGQVLKMFDYDDPAGTSYPQCAGSLCNGKLAATARWNNTDLGGLWVTEGLSYDNATGLVQRRDVSIASTAAFTGADFGGARSFNAFGDIDSFFFPCRTDATGACMSGDPAQRVVQHGYVNGFVTSVSPGASAITYAADASVDTVTHGGVSETFVGDPSGISRPCGIFAYGSGVSLIADSTVPCGKRLSGTGTQWSSGTYAYDGAGNVRQIGSATYAYDAMQRLVSWSNTPTGSGTKAYDNAGNDTAIGSIRTTTNHYSLWTYDEGGNVTNDGKGTYAYDAFDMMTSASVSSRQFRYLYSADDERVAVVEPVVVGGVTRNKTTWTLRGLGPELQREYLDDWTSGARVFSLKEDEISGAGLTLASITPSSTRYYAIDHLGSPRYVTSSTGAALGTQNFAPFGTGGTSTGGALQFTAQERDQANVGSGTADLPDYFHARYYRPALGRFLSVDPGRDWDLRQPQSWNMYSYVRNNPVRYVDPTGRVADDATDEKKPKKDPKPKVDPGPKPPVPVPGIPGADWKWNPDPGNSRGGSWGPTKPRKGKGGGQPSASQETGGPVDHWDVDDGLGNRRRYDDKGNFLTPEEAHGKPSNRQQTLTTGEVLGLIGLSIVGTAIFIMTGGSATLQPASGLVIVPTTPTQYDSDKECPTCA